MARDIFTCNVSELKGKRGYFLASNVYDDKGARVLLNANCPITDKVLGSLEKWGITSVRVATRRITDGDLSDDDVGLAEFNATKIKGLLKDIFREAKDEIGRSFQKSRSVEPEVFERVKDQMEKVLEEAMKCTTAALHLGIMGEKEPHLLRHSTNLTYLGINLLLRYKGVRDLLRCDKKGLRPFSTNNRVQPVDPVGFGMSCLLHDIGKIPILELIDHGEKIAADDPVWEKIRQHPQIGHDILFGKGVDAHALLGIKYHHENINGSGYPYGIRGYKIHIYARLIRILDSFDAATSGAPGRNDKDPDEVIEELRAMSHRVYDPELVDFFGDMIHKAVGNPCQSLPYNS